MALTKKDIAELGAVFAAAMNPKEKKAKKAKSKFVMIVDNKVMADMVPSMKVANRAARAIILSALANGKPEPKIAIAEINAVIAIDVPVSSTAVAGIEA